MQGYTTCITSFTPACQKRDTMHTHTGTYIQTYIHICGGHTPRNPYTQVKDPPKDAKRHADIERKQTEATRKNITYTWPWSNKKKTYVQRKREREIRTGKGLLGERDKVNRSWYGW